MEGFRLEQFWFTLLHSSDSRELWHPELEVIFLLQGTGRVYFPDLKTAYTLRQRDIFAVNGFEVLALVPGDVPQPGLYAGYPVLPLLCRRI